MSEEEIKIFIDEYYKLKNIQNSIKEIDKNFFFDLVDKLLYLYNKEKENNKKEYNLGYKEGLAKALEIMSGGKDE